ncbi:hypothetical protein F4861DRAFT_540927 [Xylaria intraflava]|nr:hypothetical protein F4861DRAFT_540927 [Xylaria intraflava]
MPGPLSRFKAQDALFRCDKRKQRHQYHGQPKGFDSLSALEDEDMPEPAVPEPGTIAGESALSMNARRKVDEWLDRSDFHTPDSPSHTFPDIQDGGIAGSGPHTSLGGDTSTLDIISGVLSRAADDHDAVVDQVREPPASPMVPLTDAAARIVDAANQREAAEFDDIDELLDIDDSVSDTATASVSCFADRTKEVVHYPKQHSMSAFQTMLAIWESEHSVTRDAHTQLVEIFQLAQSLDEIQQTSRRQATPLKRVVQSLPLHKLRKVTVQLDHTALPSRTKLEENLLVFDMSEIVSSILSSPHMRGHIYQGMACLTDGRVESPWQANWWGESIRTTSGQFFPYPDGGPIFPSDFVRWRCPWPQCFMGSLHCGHHLGRVRYCGWDKRHATTSTDATATMPILLVQKVIERDLLFGDMASDIASTGFIHRTVGTSCSELVLVEDDEVSLSPGDIIEHVPDIEMDYHYDPNGPGSVRPGPLTSPYTIRLIYNRSRRQYRVVRLSSPHRAELELNAFGRAYLTEAFAKKDVISLPFQMFIDAFGLYRNMYRSLLGVYLTPEFFAPELRSKRSNIFPLTLGPHGADLVTGRLLEDYGYAGKPCTRINWPSRRSIGDWSATPFPEGS